MLYKFSPLHSFVDVQSLGWEVLKEGQYTIPLPRLSPDEQELIIEVENYFREITRIREFSSPEETKDELLSTLSRVCHEKGYEIDEEQETYLVNVAYLHIYGLGFFEHLLADNNIEEIALIGLGKPVYVYVKGKGWLKTNALISSETYLMELVNKMASLLGRRITLQNPRLDTTLPDGSRLHASLPPISNGEITIRRFNATPLSMKSIVSFGTMRNNLVAIMSLLMQGDFSVLVAGNTASGKTTVLNSLFSFVPYNERILITEETPEINVLQEHSVRLVANPDMDIKLLDLVYDSLRMRPDRIVVGEIRNKEEARALLDVLLAGQARGAYATFHGKSAEEALSRLMSFGISEMDVNSIDAILVQRRMMLYDRQKRRVEERRRATSLNLVIESKPVPIFTYNVNKDSWKITNMPLVYDVIGARLGLSNKEVKEEIAKRTALMEKAPSDFKDFYKFMQRSLYGLA
ncbi:MAG: CpaF family protein [Methanobacteriota archaeon]|nr:MAG: CpaF family protein [Euryarchaeota archaeon]